MNWVQNLVVKLFRIQTARNREVLIKELTTFQGNAMMHEILYRGDPVEIEQYFKSIAQYDVQKARFWAATPSGCVRKIHSGIVSVVIDRYKDIVTSGIHSVEIDDKNAGKVWSEIDRDNQFVCIVGKAVQTTLSVGDGAFKISIDSVSKYPILEFYKADDVDYQYRYGRLQAIKYYTTYYKEQKIFRLEEIYSKGSIDYKLYSGEGKEVPLNTIDETSGLVPVTFHGDFIMGVPFIVFESSKWENRGKPLFENKVDDIDALDEIISQWLDAVRAGRINKYIPEDLIPVDDKGQLQMVSSFDNQYIKISSSAGEDDKSKIEVVQPDISYEAYVNSYTSFLDLVLQGIISPSTIGIDLSKKDNAEAQREKEKITMYVRNKIIDALDKVLTQIIPIMLMVYDNMLGHAPGVYEVSIKYDEYASPDFDSTVETVVKARSGGVMSVEKSVEQMYGDSMTEDEKQKEILRIKEEQGIAIQDEPMIGDDVNHEGKNSKSSLQDEQAGVQGTT